MVNPVIDEARKWLGTPFVHQGRAMGRGVDCAGLIVGVAKSLGYLYGDQQGYGRIPTKNTLKSRCDQYAQRIKIGDELPGDFYLMTFRGNPQHLAIYTGKGIIHAWQGAGRCVEHRMDAAWRKRIVAAYRYCNG